jgi:hypothetical protein
VIKILIAKVMEGSNTPTIESRGPRLTVLVDKMTVCSSFQLSTNDGGDQLKVLFMANFGQQDLSVYLRLKA